MSTIADADRRCIEAMLAAAVRALDDGRLADFPEFFVDTASYKVTTRSNLERNLPFCQIYCVNRAMLVDRVVSAGQAIVFARDRYRRFTSGLEIVAEGADRFRTRSNYLVVRTTGDGCTALFSTGEYRDRIVVADGVARFEERLVVQDGDAVDTALVVPL